MDWSYGFNAQSHVNPRAAVIDGARGLKSLRFNTRYGSVVLSSSTDAGGAVDAASDRACALRSRR